MKVLFISAFASVKLDCNGNKLQGLCPSVNEQRMCTCVTSGNTLRWSTTQAGVCFTAPSVSRFSSADPVGRSAAHTMGITAVLTNNTEGQLTSILIFKPSVMSATGLKIKVSCENPSTGEGLGNTLTVAYSGGSAAVLWSVYHCVAFHVFVLCHPVHSLSHPYIS